MVMMKLTAVLDGVIALDVSLTTLWFRVAFAVLHWVVALNMSLTALRFRITFAILYGVVALNMSLATLGITLFNFSWLILDSWARSCNCIRSFTLWKLS
jgi:hypothetical protein